MKRFAHLAGVATARVILAAIAGMVGWIIAAWLGAPLWGCFIAGLIVGFEAIRK